MILNAGIFYHKATKGRNVTKLSFFADNIPVIVSRAAPSCHDGWLWGASSKIQMLSQFFLFCTFITFVPITAYAQNCIGPDGVHGDLLYNNAYDVFQGCTTRGWRAFHEPRPPPDCPNAGDICDTDGTIYAGVFDGHKLYIAADDAPSTRTWGPRPNASGVGFCVLPFTVSSCKNGRKNTQFLKDHTLSFPAAEYCADLVAHGYDDWYLPSFFEIAILNNLAAGKPAGTYNLQDSKYWSSSELSSDFAYMSDFAIHGSSGDYKTPSFVGADSHRVRCMRH